MKTCFPPLGRWLRVVAAGNLALGIAAAQQPADQPEGTDADANTTEEVTNDEIATGRVFSIEPTALLVTPANVTIPLNFTYNPKTPLLDETDKPVPWDQLRGGVPVTVHYTTQGEKLVATKVIVTRKMLAGGEAVAPNEAGRKREMLAELNRQRNREAAERGKAVPAGSGGIIMGFEQVITVGGPDSNDLVQYVVNNSTLYVDSTGKPVPLHLVRTGTPVSIQYVEDSGRKIATQFVIERIPRGAAAAARSGGATTTGAGSQPPGTAAAPQPTIIDQNGNVVPANLADGFVNPPVTVLPGAVPANQLPPPGSTPTTPTQPGTGPTAGENSTTPAGNQPAAGAAPGNEATPGARQPTTPQPGTQPPATRAPATRPPGTSPATPPGTPPGTPPAGSPGSPAPGR